MKCPGSTYNILVPELRVAACNACAVEYVTLGDVALFANRMSQAERLEPCYNLESCSFEGSHVLCERGIEWQRECTGFRLPTMAEWMAIASGGRSEPWGFDAAEADAQRATFTADNPDREVAQGPAQKTYSNCANDSGAYNTIGNVAELVWDRLDSQTFPPWTGEEPFIDPVSTGTSAVACGGSYVTPFSQSTAASCELVNLPAVGVGFRLVRTL